MTASPHPLVIKGRQAFQAGNISGALSMCSMRLNEAPDDSFALELKSVIQSARGDERGAEATMHQAIAHDPKSPWALNDLTLLLYNQGHRAAAEAAARDAVIRLPDDPQAHLQLAVILGEKDDLPAAEYHNRRALDLAGPHPQILLNLGLTLYNQGRIEEALPALLEAQKMQPDSAQIMAHISRAFEARRDMADAFIWLERAEALGRKTGEDFTLLRALYLSNAEQPKQALELIEAHGTLAGPAMLDRARLLDKLGRYDEAMQGFVTAKAKLADDMGLRYDAPKVAAEFTALKSFFTADTLQRLPRARVRKDVPQPIFVLGFPRSGTTMIEQMLDAHPDVSAGGELPFVHEWQALIEDLLPGGAPFPLKLAQAETFDYQHIAGTLRDYYLDRAETYGLIKETAFFTDKMPLNDVYLPLIRLAFPQSTIIRMVRHPLDVALSMLSHNLTHGYNSGYKIETIIEHMVAMHDLTTHYDAVLGNPALTLKYEDFVADQRGHTLRVLGRAGLGFHEATLRFHANPRHAPTPSYAQVSKPLNAKSIGRWKPYERFFRPFLPQIGPVIEALGYLT